MDSIKTRMKKAWKVLNGQSIFMNVQEIEVDDSVTARERLVETLQRENLYLKSLIDRILPNGRNGKFDFVLTGENLNEDTRTSLEGQYIPESKKKDLPPSKVRANIPFSIAKDMIEERLRQKAQAALGEKVNEG